jgi:predicted phosphodiesterase
VLHDVFDGKSISHHNEGKLITLTKLAEKGRLSLRDELNGYVSDLKTLSKNHHLVVVKSNHDEHLERYLNEARYIGHPHNHKLSLTLASWQVAGFNPLEQYFLQEHPEEAENVTFLERDQSFKIAGIELGAHGDKGANGSRGSSRSMENAYGKCVYGHTHTPEISREAWCVGTTSLLQLDYNVGPSSWFHTSCLVYENGQRQLLNCIDGKVTKFRLA